MTASPADLDCQACGACCCNPAENRAEGFRDYVEVEPGAKLWKKPALLQRYSVQNERGERHLKLLGGEERCAALLGSLGKRVRCSIYEWRPRGCKKVEAGDASCLRYRKERGLS